MLKYFFWSSTLQEGVSFLPGIKKENGGKDPFLLLASIQKEAPPRSAHNGHPLALFFGGRGKKLTSELNFVSWNRGKYKKVAVHTSHRFYFRMEKGHEERKIIFCLKGAFALQTKLERS